MSGFTWNISRLFSVTSSLLLYPFIHSAVIWCICLFVSVHSRRIKPLYRLLHQDRCVLVTRKCLIVTQVEEKQKGDLTLWLYILHKPSQIHGKWIMYTSTAKDFQRLALQSVRCVSLENMLFTDRVSRIFARLFALLDLRLLPWHYRWL